VLASEWGRLFQNWEHVPPDASGYPDVGAAPAVVARMGAKALRDSVGILGTCIVEAPEFSNRKRKVVTANRA